MREKRESVFFWNISKCSKNVIESFYYRRRRRRKYELICVFKEERNERITAR